MISDLRFAFRSLLKTPGFTLVVVLSLALGMAANATVFCWLHAMLYDCLPGVQQQERMVVLKSNQGGGNINSLDAQDFAKLKDIFVGGEISQLGPVFMESDGKSEWLYSQICSQNYFELLGVKPVIGRFFSPTPTKGEATAPMLVISEDLWKRRFAGSPSVIGKTVRLNRHVFTILGVAPRAFSGTMTGVSMDCWAPVELCNELYSYDRKTFLEERFARPFHNLFRLQPGVSLEQAQAAVSTLDKALALSFPRSNEGVQHEVLPLSKAPYGAQTLLLSALRLLFCISILVLLIVASNVTNLLLSRAVRRSKEIAIRLATGASRAQLLRLFLTESLGLSVVGGLLGLLLSSWMVDSIGLLIPVSDIPTKALSFQLTMPTILMTLGLSLLTGLLIGLVPAFQFSQSRLGAALKDGGRSSSGTSHHGIRRALVIGEVALSILLLICASLCVQGFRKASSTNPGFDRQGVLVAKLSLGHHGYNETRGMDFYARLQERLSQLPGVRVAALGSFLPMGFEGCKGTDAQIEGRIRPEGEDKTYERTLVSPGYFGALRMPLLSGRDFTPADDLDSQRVVIINEALAERFWPGQDPLGRELRSSGQKRRVIGVVRNIVYYRVNEKPRCHLYFPYTQGVPELDLDILVRVDGDPLAFADQVRKTVASLDPLVDLRRSMTLADHTLAAFFANRVASWMISMMGLVALGLAAMGIYAVMAYAVNQRMSEFGLRLALGASRRDIIALVLRQGLVLTVIGILIGLSVSMMATRLMSDFLFGISPFDPFTFVLVPLLLSVVAISACLLPALRATRADPMETLRMD